LLIINVRKLMKVENVTFCR